MRPVAMGRKGIPSRGHCRNKAQELDRTERALCPDLGVQGTHRRSSRRRDGGWARADDREGARNRGNVQGLGECTEMETTGGNPWRLQGEKRCDPTALWNLNGRGM